MVKPPLNTVLLIVNESAAWTEGARASKKLTANNVILSIEILHYFVVLDECVWFLIDAPLPMELQEYRQFTYKRVTVNAHKCFSVCFTVSRNIRVME